MVEQAKMMELAKKLVETREELASLIAARTIMDMCGGLVGKASKYIDTLEYMADEDLEKLSMATDLREQMKKPIANLDNMVEMVKKQEDKLLPDILSIFDEIITMGKED